MAKFSESRVWDSSRGIPLFFEVPESPLTQYRTGGRKPPYQDARTIDSFSRFDRTPTCDRHRQTHDYSKYRASIASRDRNENFYSAIPLVCHVCKNDEWQTSFCCELRCRSTRYCDECCCLRVRVCLRTYLQNNMNYEFMNYTLYELFYACHLWPWLGSPSPLAALRYVQHFRL